MNYDQKSEKIKEFILENCPTKSKLNCPSCSFLMIKTHSLSEQHYCSICLLRYSLYDNALIDYKKFYTSNDVNQSHICCGTLEFCTKFLKLKAFY